MERDTPRKIRVLVAEDHPLVRDAVRSFIEAHDDLELLGAAADADEAIALVGTMRPDVLLVDMRMPHGGGTRVAAEVRASAGAPAVVVLSANDDARAIAEAMSAGASSYVVKGAGCAEVCDAIRRAAAVQTIGASPV